MNAISKKSRKKASRKTNTLTKARKPISPPVASEPHGPALKNLSRPKVELAQFGVLRIDARKFARMWAALISQALIDKLQIIERYNHRTKRLLYGV